MKKLNLVGNVYGRWTVLRDLEPLRKGGHSRVECVCTCGTVKSVDISGLRAGTSKSCGCLCAELTKEREKTHGLYYTKEYNIYRSMVDRCYNDGVESFPWYGGKGITVHESWVGLGGFEKFIEHVGLQPSDNLKWSIERIDSAKNYEPHNVKWVEWKFQARNRGKSVVNKTGVTGVEFDAEENRYRACWTCIADENGKRRKRSKSFSINKYSKDEAFRLACEFRAKMIAELNKQGAGYTDTHGT